MLRLAKTIRIPAVRADDFPKLADISSILGDFDSVLANKLGVEAMAAEVSTGELPAQLVAIALTEKHRFSFFSLSNFLHFAQKPHSRKHVLAEVVIGTQRRLIKF